MSPPAAAALEEVARRFAAEGCALAVRPIGTGRWLAVAAKAELDGAGPVAMGDTPAGAARLAWSRFEGNRDHYVRPLDPDSEEPRGGTALRRLRHARGLSQRQLASAASVSVTTINRLELDRRAVPTAPTRVAIAHALETSVGDVFPDLPR
jgi:DNA-binding XRE family transcriptional regulator